MTIIKTICSAYLVALFLFGGVRAVGCDRQSLFYRVCENAVLAPVYLVVFGWEILKAFLRVAEQLPLLLSHLEQFFLRSIVKLWSRARIRMRAIFITVNDAIFAIVSRLRRFIVPILRTWADFLRWVLAKAFKFFSQIGKLMARAFGTVARFGLHVLEQIGKPVWRAIRIVARRVLLILKQVWRAIRTVARLAFHVLGQVCRAIRTVARFGLHVLEQIGKPVWRAIRIVARRVLLILKQVWRAIRTVARFGLRVLEQIGEQVWHAIRTIARFGLRVLEQIGKSVWHAIRTIARFGLRVLEQIGKPVWRAIQIVARRVLPILKQVWRAIRTIAQFLSRVGEQMARAFGTVARFGLRILKQISEQVWCAFGIVARRVLLILKQVWRIIRIFARFFSRMGNMMSRTFETIAQNIMCHLATISMVCWNKAQNLFLHVSHTILKASELLYSMAFLQFSAIVSKLAKSIAGNRKD
ncbi:MAG: hypothetical protein ACYCOU_01665 [Sulfobacillus sp.]